MTKLNLEEAKYTGYRLYSIFLNLKIGEIEFAGPTMLVVGPTTLVAPSATEIEFYMWNDGFDHLAIPIIPGSTTVIPKGFVVVVANHKKSSAVD